MNVNIFEKANRIVRSSDAAYFGVIDEGGFPSVSAVSPVKPEGILEVYFTTNLGGNKATRLQKCNKASFCFREGGSNVTLVGTAEILTDQETKSKYWLDWFKDHYAGGVTDPSYIVVKFTTNRVSLWIDNEGAEFTVGDLLAVQSCCGLLCDGCSYKESHGCAGCIAVGGKPFWGECPVAACCHGKGYVHCGECADIPCDILNEFSCGEDEHSDKPAGARIAVCKAWAANKR
ncbi:MAG: pyridoxamine 5'-phosphate oxidase family protein [Oscillospiraceae bacterium]|nr:pyridoxamine 5'-phosphate oxidase family protein [Oscillospiraceae bacterium]